MGNEKFVNYYIEGLITTLNDCLIRNISLQANERIGKEAIEEHSKKVEGLNGIIDALKLDLESKKKNESESDSERYRNLENSINDHLNTINRLNGEISQLNTMKSDYENVKHQVQHVDTFRAELNNTREELNNVRNDYENVKHQIKDVDTFKTELNNTREELNNVRNDYEKRIADLNNSHELKIKDLNEKIDYLQLTPTKKKKIEEVKKETADTSYADVFSGTKNILEDGGSF
jgi:chromosome segregation ATPase